MLQNMLRVRFPVKEYYRLNVFPACTHWWYLFYNDKSCQETYPRHVLNCCCGLSVHNFHRCVYTINENTHIEKPCDPYHSCHPQPFQCQSRILTESEFGHNSPCICPTSVRCRYNADKVLQNLHYSHSVVCVWWWWWWWCWWWCWWGWGWGVVVVVGGGGGVMECLWSVFRESKLWFIFCVKCHI